MSFFLTFSIFNFSIFLYFSFHFLFFVFCFLFFVFCFFSFFLFFLSFFFSSFPFFAQGIYQFKLDSPKVFMKDLRRSDYAKVRAAVEVNTQVVVRVKVLLTRLTPCRVVFHKFPILMILRRLVRGERARAVTSHVAQLTSALGYANTLTARASTQYVTRLTARNGAGVVTRQALHRALGRGRRRQQRWANPRRRRFRVARHHPRLDRDASARARGGHRRNRRWCAAQARHRRK